MKFYNIKDKKPEIGQKCLIKFGDSSYYVVIYKKEWPDEPTIFVEASGEEYYHWEESEVIGWMPIEELDKIEVEE